MIQGALGEGGRDLSIMIPTGGRVGCLAETLRSLQGQGVGNAQVAVVDDRFREDDPEDDPEAVVAAVAAGWAGFHRQAVRLGPVGNLNSCLGRAERRWVHVLQGTELVLPGAYARLAAFLDTHPASRAVFGRCVLVDHRGLWDEVSPVLGPALEGPLPYDPFRWALNPVQVAGTLFRRDAGVAVGGFDDRFGVAADWDLWWKLAKRFPAGYTNRCLATVRRPPTAASSSSTGPVPACALSDSLRMVQHLAGAERQAGPALFGPLLAVIVEQTRLHTGDTAAVAAHLRLLASFPPGVPRARTMTGTALRWLRGRMT